MEKLNNLCLEFLAKENFDFLSWALFDFETAKFQVQQIRKRDDLIEFYNDDVFFDLASITKPLVMGFSSLKFQSKITEEIRSLVEHRAGLPSWGLLSHDSWREQISSYDIKENSDVLYSDFSALRAMLEIEKLTGTKLQTEVESEFKNILFWQSLGNKQTPEYGKRKNVEIKGVVHDPNAYTIDEFCSHAGLFATPQSLLEAMFRLDDQYNLLTEIHSQKKDNLSKRFISGWDTVTDTKLTLAGEGASETTFGHLGFVGNHVWIDPVRKKGHLVVSNFAKNHWYNQNPMRDFRKSFGKLAWQYMDSHKL